MEKCTNAVKMVIGGKEWYYQSYYEDGKRDVSVRLYDGSGEYLREFWDMDSMVTWVKEENEREQRKSREKMQETFMRRFEQLKGERSDSAFAGDIGMSPASVYQYLIGKRFPTAEALKEIADKCGVTMDWLVGRTD